jgi:hypothetical protein
MPVVLTRNGIPAGAVDEASQGGSFAPQHRAAANAAPAGGERGVVSAYTFFSFLK